MIPSGRASEMSFDRNLNQRAGFNFAGDRRFRQQADAGADFDRPLDRFDIVERERHANGDLVGREGGVDLFANLEAFLKCHERFVAQHVQS